MQEYYAEQDTRSLLVSTTCVSRHVILGYVRQQCGGGLHSSTPTIWSSSSCFQVINGVTPCDNESSALPNNWSSGQWWLAFVCGLGYLTSIARNDFLSSIHDEQTVRTHLQTENILQRLLKRMSKSSSRIFFWIPSSYVHFITNNLLNPKIKKKLHVVVVVITFSPRLTQAKT